MHNLSHSQHQKSEQSSYCQPWRKPFCMPVVLTVDYFWQSNPKGGIWLYWTIHRGMDSS